MTSPSLSLYKIVVFPAASNPVANANEFLSLHYIHNNNSYLPHIRTRTSLFLQNAVQILLRNDSPLPMVSGYSTLRLVMQTCYDVWTGNSLYLLKVQ